MSFKCPRCGSSFFEYYSTYGYCPACDYNTVEGHAYSQVESMIPKGMEDLVKKISKEIDDELSILWNAPTKEKKEPKQLSAKLLAS